MSTFVNVLRDAGLIIYAILLIAVASPVLAFKCLTREREKTYGR